MTPHVFHTTLCYRHDQLSDEKLNVAVLVIFPESDRVELLFPSSSDLTHRLKSVYLNLQSKLIWQYLRSFDEKAKKMSGRLKSYLGNYESLIHDHFLTENGGSLFFSELQLSPLWKDEPRTLTALYHRFLSGYERDALKTEEFITERHIATKVRDLIKEAFDKRKKTNYQLYFKEEQRIISSGVFQFTSTGFWKNGTVNLIHPLSLDVKTVEGIVSKCLFISKSAELLREQAEEENVNFHLVLARPHLKELQSAYEESVAVLEATVGPISIIRPEEQKEYTEKIVKKAVVL